MLASQESLRRLVTDDRAVAVVSNQEVAVPLFRFVHFKWVMKTSAMSRKQAGGTRIALRGYSSSLGPRKAACKDPIRWESRSFNQMRWTLADPEAPADMIWLISMRLLISRCVPRLRFLLHVSKPNSRAQLQ